MRQNVTRYLWAVGLVALASCASVLARSYLALPDLVMVYLMVIMVVAVRFGRGPAIAAATVSVAAYDVLFIVPYFTFAVANQRHLLTFAMMFGVGLLLSELTLRVRRQEAEAKAAALRARTEEMRSSLLSAVSHDLRTPLAAITGAATTLRDATVANTDQRDELVATICEEAERLERLVGNLLDMTRLESGAIDLKRDWVSLEEVVGAALGRVEPALVGREVAVDVPADLPLLSADPVLLEQMLVNLVDNAAKHTTDSIAISARTADRAVVVEIADRGPGIFPGDSERIFERFARGATTKIHGVGLGLAICRGIAQVHGGSISAQSRSGGGAVFRVQLPLVGDAPGIPDEPEIGVSAGATP